jgi:hypothetical protein
MRTLFPQRNSLFFKISGFYEEELDLFPLGLSYGIFPYGYDGHEAIFWYVDGVLMRGSNSARLTNRYIKINKMLRSYFYVIIRGCRAIVQVLPFTLV